MSRRRRSWPARNPGWTLLAAAVTAGTVRQWPWESLAAALTLTAAVGAYAWARAVWSARHAVPADARPCGLYRHYFTNGAPLYVGITNHYPARCAQHAQASWWWPYVDPSRSTWQQWTADLLPAGVTPRAAAKAAETQAILTDAPIGNTDENPLFWEQEPYRRQLKQAVGWVDNRPAPAAARSRRLSWRAA